MRAVRRFFTRLVSWATGCRDDQRLREEVEEHLALETARNLRAGLLPQDARRQAVLKFGAVEAIKQDYRDQRGLPFLDHLLQDLRFATRQLWKNAGFTFTAILMLALGMCSTVAIFAFVDAALIKPLPYRNPDRLVGLFESIELGPQYCLSYPDYLDWKRLNKVFRSVEAYESYGFLLNTSAGAKQQDGARVSDGFFRTLGVRPALGRDFYSGEDLPSATRTVMLSYAAWQKRYGGKPDVLGRTITLDGAPNIIIGVLPQDFHFAPVEPAEFWTTLDSSGSCERRRICRNLFGIARLKDGISVQAALSNMTAIARQLEKQYPDSNRGQGAAVFPLTEVIVGDTRPILLVLLGGAGLLLLIAYVNVASLLLVRSESRKREIAVRNSLGASTLRLIRQFVTEGLVLVAAGSALGVASAYGAMQLLTRLIGADRMAGMPYLQGLGLNIRVVVFAGAIALLAAVLFSITPSLHFSFSEIRQGLAEGSRGSAGNTWRRFGSKLVVLELAIAMVLLVGAMLLGKSFCRLLQVDTGFQPDHLATLLVEAPESRYVKNEQVVALERQLLDRTRTVPGVNLAGISNSLPVAWNGPFVWFQVVGRPYHGEHNEVTQRQVSSGYLRTLKARLLRGRYFSDAEDASKHHVVIINQALAKQYFRGEDPIGKQIAYTASSRRPMEIIGVVDDIKEGPLEAAIWPAIYVPFNQNPARYFAVVVRTSQSEESLLPSLAGMIHRLDPAIATYDEASMNRRIRDSPSAYLHRSSAWLVGTFAALALLLGAMGLYGVVAYSVSRRTREIGVRMALGAHRRSIYELILKEAGWLTAVGIVIGLVCSLAAAMLLRKLLFGVRAWDFATLVSVAGVLAISAILASFLPARRAASVNPVEALRTE